MYVGNSDLLPVHPIEICGNSIGLAGNIGGFFNGTFVESFDAIITSDASTITMTLEQSGGGNLTMRFSDGYFLLNCSPTKASVALTAGTDTAPQANYVYIPQSTKVLTVSTSDWPSAEHIKVAYFYVQSASLVNTGASGNNWGLINQNWNDHSAGTDGQGHMSHIAELGRRGGPGWRSGCEGVATQDGNDLWVSIAAGVMSQMHQHTFAALDSDTAGAGDPIVVINDPDAAFTQINSLNSITKDSGGTALGNNKWLKLVLWAVINKGGEPSPMMINLPSGTYNTQAEAETDVEGKATFTIPGEFAVESSTGFLIASFVCQHTATAMVIGSTQDLRGQDPSNVAGGGTGGGDVTATAVIADNALVRGDGGAKGIQGCGWLMADNDNLLAPTTAQLQFDNTGHYMHAPDANTLLINADNALKLSIGSAGQVTIETDVMFPASDNTLDLGKATTNWFKDLHLKGVLYVGNTDTAINTSLGQLRYDVATGKAHLFLVNSATEVTLAADTLTFNNGATDTGFDWSASGVLTQTVGGTGQVSVEDGAVYGVTDNDIDLGKATTNWFKDGYIKGNLYFGATGNYIVDVASIQLFANGSVSNVLAVGGTPVLTTAAALITNAQPMTGPNYTSTVATGTAPYACTSTTLNTNLNADQLDGHHITGIVQLDGVDDTPESKTATTTTVMPLVLSSASGCSACYFDAYGYLTGTSAADASWTIVVQDPNNVTLATVNVLTDRGNEVAPFFIRGYDTGPDAGATGYHLDVTENSGSGTLTINQTMLFRVLS